MRCSLTRGEAERVLRAAHGRAPDSVVVLNNLAQALSDQGRNDEALPFAEQAAAQSGPLGPAVQETRQTILNRIWATRQSAPPALR